MNVPELMQCSRSLEEFAPDYAQVLDELAGLLVRVAMKQTISDFEGDDLYAPGIAERWPRRCRQKTFSCSTRRRSQGAAIWRWRRIRALGSR